GRIAALPLAIGVDREADIALAGELFGLRTLMLDDAGPLMRDQHARPLTSARVEDNIAFADLRTILVFDRLLAHGSQTSIGRADDCPYQRKRITSSAGVTRTAIRSGH